MGNAPAWLGVAIDHPAEYPEECYVPGQPLSGRVCLSVTSAEGAVAESLQLTLSCIERALVTLNKLDTKVHGQHVLYSTTVTLATFAGGRVQPGQYEYPWRIDALPEGLPSSMFASSSRSGEYPESWAEVSWAVDALLYRPGMSKRGVRVWSKRDVSAEETFAVSAAPSPAAVPTPVFLPPSTRPVKLLCCISQGSMTLGALVDRLVVTRGGHFVVSYAIKNNSTQELRTMRAALTEWQDAYVTAQ